MKFGLYCSFQLYCMTRNFLGLWSLNIFYVDVIKKKKSQVEGWCHQASRIGDPSIHAPWTSTIEQLSKNTDISERAYEST